MISSVKQASRVVCFRSIHYELPVNTAFHPAFFSASKHRICGSLEKANTYHASVLRRILKHPAAKRVWAIVLEENNKPVYVIRNLAFTETKLTFRRVLLVNCDSIPLNHIEIVIDMCVFSAIIFVLITSMIYISSNLICLSQ